MNEVFPYSSHGHTRPGALRQNVRSGSPPLAGITTLMQAESLSQGFSSSSEQDGAMLMIIKQRSDHNAVRRLRVLDLKLNSGIELRRFWFWLTLFVNRSDLAVAALSAQQLAQSVFDFVARQAARAQLRVVLAQQTIVKLFDGL